MRASRSLDSEMCKIYIEEGYIRSHTLRKHLSINQAIDIPNSKFLSVRNDHDPLLGSRVPDDFGIPELSTANGEDRVFGILCEGVSPISRVSNLFVLSLGV